MGARRKAQGAGRKVTAILGVTLALGGCFPTLHNARIENGFHLDVGTTVLTDQQRNDREQGTDLMPFIGPTLGLGGWVEFGLPIGLYVEGGDDIGAEETALMVWPYAKVSLLPPGGRDHLALLLQGAWVLPAAVGLRYGRELDGWEPHIGLTGIFSGGPAGDDPLVTRYQEARQRMVAVGVGATWLGRARPSVEVGLLRNRYDEGAVLGDFGQPTVRRTLVDLFVAGRVRW